MEGDKYKHAKRSKTEPWSWIDLPRDVTANILHRLGAVEILESAQRVCTTWLNVCKDPLMRRVIDMKNKGHKEKKFIRLFSAFLRALDLSQGQLIDVRLEYFWYNEWLLHLTRRSPQLKCLRIASCPGILGKNLAENVAKFPLLEELHLFDMRRVVSAQHIEAIGHSCPNLKSFTYDHKGFHEIIKSDGLALAVAKTMPGLLHLRLFGNKLTNKGLQAILDDCPCLESLDLRQCYNVVLEGDLEKRCSKQMKSLKRPLDATGDEWVPVNDPNTDFIEVERIYADLGAYQENNRDIYCFMDPPTFVYVHSDSDSDNYSDSNSNSDSSSSSY